jgi:hypothetical protein
MNAYDELHRRLLDEAATKKRAKKTPKPRKQTLKNYMDEVLQGKNDAVIPETVVGTLPKQPTETLKEKQRRILIELLEDGAL